MSSDCPRMRSEINANGTVSGSASRMVIGCSQDSNCAARMRYMKMNDIPKARMKALPVRAISFDCPNGTNRNWDGRFSCLTAFSSAAPTSPEPTPGDVLARKVTCTWRA